MQFGTSSTSKTLSRSMIFLIVTDRFETKFFFIKLFSGVFKHTSEVYILARIQYQIVGYSLIFDKTYFLEEHSAL